MTSRRLQGRVGNPFVRQGTIRDMATVAKKLAMIRSAVEEVEKAEDVISSSNKGSREWSKAVEKMNLAGKKGQEWCGEAVAILNGVKRKSEGYLRGLQNAAD
jgi:hypothetical protein